jgi:hypothetical protein
MIIRVPDMHQLLAVVASLALTIPASSQVGAFDWEYVGEPTGWATIDGEEIHVNGPDHYQGCTHDGTARIMTVAPEPGWVLAHYRFDNQDYGFGYWAVEDPIYTVGEVHTYVGPGDFYFPWEGDVAFHVAAGEAFGFGVLSSDCQYGPGILDVSEFLFVPDVWDDLGGALAGSADEPLLTGIGPLMANTSWTLSLVDAAPSTPAWLVIGTSVLGAPFKGGVLVPDPGPAPVILPANTSLAGRIIWNGPWPNDVPAGIPLVMQWWIADTTGPNGYTASNGVSRTTH